MEAVLVSGAQAIQNENYGLAEGLDGSWRCRRPSAAGSFPGFSPSKRTAETEEKRRNSSSRSIEHGLRSAHPAAISIHRETKPKKKEKRVKINISGMSYETLESTLARFPTSLLGSPEKRANYFDAKKNEYFFDRNRVAFDSILYFYQSNGNLLWPVDLDKRTFLGEIEFFELQDLISPDFFKEFCLVSMEDPPPMPKNFLLRKVWEVFEYPHSSIPAKVLAIWSVGVILLSIVIFCIETLPELRKTRFDSNSPLNKIEIFCVIWFTFELFVRFIAAPKKLDFIRSFLNVIDFIAVLPYYIILGIGSSAFESKKNSSLISFLRILRLIRVFRIFKLSRHYRGLKVLGKTLKASLRELLLLTFFLLMGVIIFSSAVFYVESAHFSSIPEAFWFSVVTMTTVGYGDKAPVSSWGKLIGSCCAIAGVLTLALPVPVIVSNFSYFYNQDRERREFENDKRPEEISGGESTSKISKI
ncbi:potassium voltage-gated channel subfamily A member 6 [Exaiptasia diaphana]|uniref:BTB domain-containing protein n=1 Tax=Exaiptasia diaphana TaxID=2652724 RepID=A0A913XE82_EXADI|nr:potassium voltage-gated channel subfamily A member 6 [Exaiptasia diaphana]